jgi:hypothetical protein
VSAPMSGCVLSLICCALKINLLGLYLNVSKNSFLQQCHEFGTQGTGRRLLPFGDLLPAASLVPVTKLPEGCHHVNKTGRSWPSNQGLPNATAMPPAWVLHLAADLEWAFFVMDTGLRVGPSGF